MSSAPATASRDNLSCPLCRRGNASEFGRDRRRRYLGCRHCGLVFVPPDYHLTPAEDKSHYDLHRNHPGDTGYRNFLNRVFEPLVQRLPAGSTGLDFGSGPGPTLSVMFEEAGHSMAVYDRYYAPDAAVLEREYDFITATEVVEHLARPDRELERLWGCLRPGGWLGLMTKLVLDRAAFGNWHYKNDPTHIVFFSRDTFAWWGRRHGASPEFIGADVILFRKN